MGNKQKLFLIVLCGVTVLTATMLGIWSFQLHQQIQARLQEKRFTPPLEFYAAPELIFRGQNLSANTLTQSFERLGYRKRDSGTPLSGGDYVRWDAETCKSVVPPELAETLDNCIGFKRKVKNSESSEGPPLEFIVFGPGPVVMEVYKGEPPEAQTSTELDPELFAQFYGDKPILRTFVELGETPPLCLNAVMAIEDSEFLEHQGVSITGLFRAVLKNLTAGRYMQGGSTITQQLVKNYFLTPEKTFKRKLREILMAVLLEGLASKDEILETYINEIYMGQNGPFEVRGFGSASHHYFSKPIDELDLPECALLAAIINSPGRFNPTVHPEDAMKRRHRVLERMEELKIISAEERDHANKIELPKKAKRILTEPAPFFVDAVRQNLQEFDLDVSEGLKVYTTLSLKAQEAAQRAVADGLDNLEKNNPKLQKLKAENHFLEGTLLAADPLSGSVQALVGGRRYKTSQFNRAYQGQRQVGSLMKPLVYLAALENNDPEGNPFQPLSLIQDQKMNVKYDRQVWSPENYDHKFYGSIPLFFGLNQSLNAATAQLAMDVGLQKIVDLAQKFGVKSKLQPLPSLALGAFELKQFEVLQIYQALAKMGELVPVHMISRVTDLNEQSVYEFEISKDQVAAPEKVAVLVGMMKSVLEHGTGQVVRKMGFDLPAAAKTGTTSETRDAWFAGFTPFHVAVTWIGYDDNTPHGLTGASGAAPIWASYMKQVATQFPVTDFRWPENVETRTVGKDFFEDLGTDPKKHPTSDVELIFEKIEGTEPAP